jgi:hypothetical protein
MKRRSKTLTQQVLPGFGSATSSQGLVAGPTPSTSSDLILTAKPGRGVVPANRSRLLAKAKARKTHGISGPLFDVLSPSASLQRSLASRLAASTDLNGSPECVLTWKLWDMPSGPQICALRARARRASDKGFTGWPAAGATDGKGMSQPNERRPVCDYDLPTAADLAIWPIAGAADGERGAESLEGRTERGCEGMNLTQTASYAIWPAAAANEFEPTSMDQMETRRAKIKAKGINGNGFGLTLGMAAHLTIWVAPTAMDGNRGGLPSRPHDTGTPLSQQVAGAVLPSQVGEDSTSSNAETEKRGVLSPEHSRWLQGFPAVWTLCAVMATQSCRRSRLRSSKRSLMQSKKSKGK